MMLLNTWHWLLPSFDDSFIVDGTTHIGTCVESFIVQDRKKDEQVFLLYNIPFPGKLTRESVSVALTLSKVNASTDLNPTS